MPSPDASRSYLATVVLARFADRVMFTTSALYYVQLFGLDPLQLVLVGTALEVAILVFEVPTGVLADTHGRRLSVVLGFLTLGTTFVLQGLLPLAGNIVPAFAALLVLQATRGVGYTFLSGAHVAWITDEVGQERAATLLMRAERLAQPAGVAGVLAGTALALNGLHVPYLAGGMVYLVLGGLAAVMPETAFRPRPRPAGARWWSGMGATLREGLATVRGQPTLMLVLLVSACAGAAAEGWDRLADAHLLLTIGLPAPERVPPALLFGLIALVGMLVRFAVLSLAGERVAEGDDAALARRLLALTALQAAGVVWFALAGGLVEALASYWLVGAVRSVKEPLFFAWLNRFVDSRVRATVLSLEGQANALGETAGGPVVGAVGRGVSLRAALLVGAALLTPMLGFYGRAARRDARASA